MQDNPDEIRDSEGAVIKDSVVVSAGQQLRQAREAAGISIDDAAHALHLDRDVIFSIEADDHAALDAPVFIRGYLRGYAKLLELEEDEVLAGLTLAEPEPKEFVTLSARKEVKLGASLTNFLLWVMAGIVVLIGLIYLGFGDEPATDEPLDKGQFVAPASRVAPVMEPQPEDKSIAVQPEPAPEPVAPEQLLNYTLSFSFSDECWLEVSDAESRLLYGLEKPGEVVSVTGRPPFRLFLGDASSVTMQIEGKDFPIPKYSGAGKNTARFTITAADLSGADEL
jgi:cytoskeleton protein RodZ